MTIKKNIEIQDHEGNIYHPHTDAKVVFLEDGTDLERAIANLGGSDSGVVTHQTVNGIKEFKSSNSFVDNVIIEGKTVVSENTLNSVGQGDKIEILTRYEGGNIFDGEMASGTLNDTTGLPQVQAESLISKNYTRVTPNSSINIYNDKNYSRTIFYYDKAFNYLGKLGTAEATNIPNDCYYIKFRTNRGQNDISVKYWISYNEMLNYEPPKQDIKRILTTLRSLPNGVKDTVEKRGNKYYSIQRIIDVDVYDAIKKHNLEIVIEKENETTSKPMVKDFVSTLGGKVDGNNVNIYCSHFKASNIYQDTITEEGVYLTTHMHNRILKSKVVGLQGTVSKNAMLAWYRTNKVKVAFELAEPIVTELSNLDLRTFSPQTIMLINSGVVQGEVIFDVIGTIESIINKIDSFGNVLGGQFEIGTESINNLLRKING